MGDKERLRQALLQDMKHWSVDTLKEAINYIDGMVLSMDRWMATTSSGGGTYARTCITN